MDKHTVVECTVHKAIYWSRVHMDKHTVMECTAHMALPYSGKISRG